MSSHSVIDLTNDNDAKDNDVVEIVDVETALRNSANFRAHHQSFDESSHNTRFRAQQIPTVTSGHNITIHDQRRRVTTPGHNITVREQRRHVTEPRHSNNNLTQSVLDNYFRHIQTHHPQRNIHSPTRESQTRRRFTPNANVYLSGAPPHRYNSEESSTISINDTQDEPKKKEIEGVECPICMDITRDLMSTKCGHLFCSDCLRHILRIPGVHYCPKCRNRISQSSCHPIYL
ncbi:hypothetical protein QTN25_006614 [Entamoeba marina]